MMIALKKSGGFNFYTKPTQTNIKEAFEPLFELRAYADGQFIPKPAIKRVRVYKKNGMGKPILMRIV